jgi:hypothetical protein
MAFTVIRAAVALLVATLLSPAPAAAQGLNKADAQAFQMFRQSLAMRRNARVCEQGIPGYGETFADLHQQWSGKHRAEIARGEALFREALNTKDLKGQPVSITPDTRKRIEESLAELAKPPRAPDSTPPTPQTTAACEQLLTFLRLER